MQNMGAAMVRRSPRWWLVSVDGRIRPARVWLGRLSGFRRLRDQFTGIDDVAVWAAALPGAWLAGGCLMGVASGGRPPIWLLVSAAAAGCAVLMVSGLLALRGSRATKECPVYAVVANPELALAAADLAVVARTGRGPSSPQRYRRYCSAVNVMSVLAPQEAPDPVVLDCVLADAAEQRRQAVRPGEPAIGSPAARGATVDLAGVLLAEQTVVGSARVGASRDGSR